MNQKRQPRGVPIGGEFAANEHDAATGSMALDLSSQEPPQIDEKLAELYDQEFRQYLKIEGAQDRIDYAAKRGRALHPRDAEHYAKVIEDAKAERARLREEMKPFEDEFKARGGWDRAYLVPGADGHVHSSTDCSTCNRMGKRTRFMWVTEYSGASEEQIIDAAGSSACTVCYPNAPVETLNRPSRILDPEYEAEKAARAAEKAERDRVRDEKGIVDPETGDRLIVDRSHIKTAVTAEREAIERILTLKFDSIRPYNNREYANEKRPGLRKLVAALANKRGETPEETLAYLEEKSNKKFKKDYGWVLAEQGRTDIPATPFEYGETR